MRLIVVIGYPDESRASKPFPVYAGRDSAEADAAMGQSDAVIFDVIKNPTTIRKRKKAVAAPVAVPAAETVGGTDGPIGEPGPAGTEGGPDTDETADAPAKPVSSGTVSGKRGRA
jgi:hypothetical protein